MSRLTRHQSKQKNLKNIILVFLSLLFAIALSIVGFQSIISSAVFVNNLFSPRSSDEAATTDEKFYGSLTLDSLPVATNSAELILTGQTVGFDIVDFYLNDELVSTTKATSKGLYTGEITSLNNGDNTIFVIGKRSNGKETKTSEEYNVIYKSDDLTLEISEPQDGTTSKIAELKIAGATDRDTTVTINRHPVVVDLQGDFDYVYRLKSEENEIIIIARDITGNRKEKKLYIKFEPEN
ncbi:hypothetical protein COY14_01535 [Candidatus Roizmanbacteria bacterium CG_4_10_14_0_2_um_filter_36_9]|uniref:Bacterial Ig-like domain-containing protein n=2 Tax=Candidatus Roizmaniibacteriota TaxID=1752723 RepID=A0A2M7U4Z5_9BACT|nr:MAG: hypothetical protein COY14_01535 [Candidatus Roizmanbacteria bacterium CG_4_10_14_0_2_um_filter_36_9]